MNMIELIALIDTVLKCTPAAFTSTEFRAIQQECEINPVLKQGCLI